MYGESFEVRDFRSFRNRRRQRWSLPRPREPLGMGDETKKIQRSAIGCTIYGGQEAKAEILDWMQSGMPEWRSWLRGNPLPWAGKRKAISQYQCCERMQWEPVADFGHVAGFDLDLGRCAACGTYVMAVFYVSSTTYNCISDKLAGRFLSLRDDPLQLKKALKKWVD